MKTFLAVCCALSVSALAAAEKNFWDSLTPEQRAMAGVEALTEQQRAALNALANRYVETRTIHEVTAATDRARAEVRATLEAEKKARVGFDQAPAATDTIRTRITGEFRGWQKGTVLRLENGQTWVVDDSDVRAFSVRRDAEVEIRPAAFGTWKLYLLPDGLWVRVRRVK